MTETGPADGNKALKTALSDLFDTVAPTDRREADEELLAAGIDPEAVATRTTRLVEETLGLERNALRRRTGARILATVEWRSGSTSSQPRRRAALWRRMAGVAAALMAAIGVWAVLRKSSDRYVPFPARLHKTPMHARLPEVTLPQSTYLAGRQAHDRGAAPTPASGANVTDTASVTNEEPTGGEPVRAETDRDPASATPRFDETLAYFVTAKNVAENEGFLSPGLAWAVREGLRMRIVQPRPVPMPDAYRRATERYAGQVRVRDDGLALMDYVAGLPFPSIDSDDVHAATKIMWNYEYRPFATDDLSALNMASATLSLDTGHTPTQRLLIEHFSRLFYNGRLDVDPRPELPNRDGVRYREGVFPVRDPANLRGYGVVSMRYQDQTKPDDTWTYVPTLRRVRRVSPDNRSDGLFGVGFDLDSFLGFSGGIGSMTWELVGEETIYGCVHAENDPVKWGEGDAALAFDDVWEPRRVYVVEGQARTAYNLYAKRVLFIDQETWVVLVADGYDRAGRLAKVWLNMYSTRHTVAPGSRAHEERLDNPAAVQIDVLNRRATRVAVPTAPDGSGAWRVNQGSISPDWFTVAAMIESGR